MATKKGRYTVHAIDAGRFGLDGGAMFGIIPRPLWSRKTTPDAAGRIPLATRCMVLESSDRLILVDTGIGDKFDDKKRSIFAVDTDAPSLGESLARRGFGLDDVTDVLLTHLHFDHCGGSTRMEGDRAVPVFPRAMYHVQRDHLTWARERNPREKASFMEENFAPMEGNGQLSLIDGDTEILPGIRVQGVHGHTQAQQIVHVEDAEEPLVFVADLIPTSAHLTPVWGMSYDIRPMVTIAEKTDFLAQAIEGNWRLFFEHDPAVVSGRVVTGKKGPELVDIELDG